MSLKCCRKLRLLQGVYVVSLMPTLKHSTSNMLVSRLCRSMRSFGKAKVLGWEKALVEMLIHVPYRLRDWSDTTITILTYSKGGWAQTQGQVIAYLRHSCWDARKLWQLQHSAPGWGWESLVTALFFSQPQAELTSPCPLTKIGGCRQSQHSPTPSLKLISHTRTRHSPLARLSLWTNHIPLPFLKQEGKPFP